jgi:hypothetical protein
VNFEKPSCAQTSKPDLRVFSYGIMAFFLAVIGTHSKAQPATDISGIVNTYHSVYDIVPAKACFLVTNAGALNENTRVLIIQMKGASILTGTGATFGDTTSLNQAGHYEVGTICAVIGDSVFLFHDILNTYDYTSGKVQMVQFAEYYSARVVGQIRPQLWDNASGTGGVVAIAVDESLELTAPIYADTAGYKGGLFHLHSGACNFFQQAGTAYAYDATDPSHLNGAYKGEGVADVPSTLDGAKGAPANGGGGGNNHNNSGGGGANLTAGGRGGGNTSSGPSGCNITNNMGLGGKALRSWNGKKIFAGGGGGAGHTNFNASTTGGGNGGGIVFIHANNLIGGSQTISANGEVGALSNSDGAGGGGAGGTIIMDVTTYTGTVNIEANGGNGGNSDDVGVPSRCFGGGGGGSGGAIYFTGSFPSLPVAYTVNFGTGGTQTGSAGTCSTPVPGLAGTIGQTFNNYVYSRSTAPASYCDLLLPVKLNFFSAVADGKKVNVRWQVENPEQARSYTVERSVVPGQWIEWRTINSNDLVKDYSLVDDAPFTGKSFYRLKIIEKTYAIEYSPVRAVQIDFGGVFSVYPNPATNKITITAYITSPVEARLLDISGKLILKRTLGSSRTDIDLGSLQTGIYLITVNGATQKLFIK